MVTHIVAWNVNDPKEKNIEFLTQTFLSMKENIPQIETVEVHTNIETAGTNRDFVLISTHKNAESATAYQKHPYHEEVKTKVAPYLSERACIDFES